MTSPAKKLSGRDEVKLIYTLDDSAVRYFRWRYPGRKQWVLLALATLSPIALSSQLGIMLLGARAEVGMLPLGILIVTALLTLNGFLWYTWLTIVQLFIRSSRRYND